MTEFDPDMHLNLIMADGAEVRMDRYNSALFTFIGRNALGEDLSLRNHVFFTYKENDKDMMSYIFPMSPVYEELEDFMYEYDFPLHLNLTEVQDCDEQAYQLMIDKQMASESFELPDWL